MTVKAILLDVDGTLLDFEKGSQEAMLSAAKTLGVDLPDDIYVTFKRINTGLWQALERGELTRQELHAVRWNRIFKAAGVDFDGEIFEKHFFSNLYSSAVLIDGAKELVEYLAQKYPIYIATNALWDQQYTRLKKAGLIEYVKEIFASEKIGAAKPSPDFFIHCISRLAPLSPEEMLMIGDSLSADIKGAKDCGINTCWFNTGSEDSEYADVRVSSLRDIKKIL